MKKTTKVTVPTYAEINGKQLLLNDYAIAMGAAGYIWLRDNSGMDDMAATYTHNGKVADKGLAFVDSDSIAVAPRFQNPKALGMKIALLDGEPILTINDRVAYQPKAYTGATLAKNLDLARKNRQFQQVEMFYNNHPCYAYQGNYYVYVSDTKPFGVDSVFTDRTKCRLYGDYWFKCEPVRAEYGRDGSIQCLDLLGVCPFATQDEFFTALTNKKYDRELNTDDFSIGQFMNEQILQNLLLSTRLTNPDIEQRVSQFKTNRFISGLKNAITAFTAKDELVTEDSLADVSTIEFD